MSYNSVANLRLQQELDELRSTAAALARENEELRASEKAIYERNVLTRNAHTEAESANRALQAEVDRLRTEEDLSEQARKMMDDILTRTVNILRGEPDPLHQYSWHDIPDRVQALIAAANSSNRGHVYYGAGEKDCPREIKSGNGELHTMMCKRCGEKNPRGICKAAIAYTGTEPQDAQQATK